MAKTHLHDRSSESASRRMNIAEMYVEAFLEDVGVRGASVIVQNGCTDTCAYEPSTHTVMVNPEFIMPDDYDDRTDAEKIASSKDSEFRILRGALIHEACHAHFSKFSLSDVAKLEQSIAQVIIALEELRIEYNGVAFIDRNKALSKNDLHADLAAGAHFIAKHNVPTGVISPLALSTCLALTVGRLDAGVISRSAAAVYYDVFSEHMDADTIDALRDLWREYLGLTDRDMDSRIRIAKEWMDIISEDVSDDNGLPRGGGKSFGDADESAEGESGEGSGEDEGSGEGDGIGDQIRAAADYAYEVTQTDEAMDARNREAAARRAMREGAVKSREKRVEAGEKAFDKSHGYSGKESEGYSGLFRKAEKPTSEEQAAMVALAKGLDRVVYVDKHMTRVGSDLPPGRLVGRGMVQAGAQKARGEVITATPWKARKRRSVPKTPLTVGIIADVSGSMGASVDSVSTAAWMLSEAVNRVHGRTATVLMGNTAYGLVAPGKRLREVPRYSAPYGFEAFADSYNAVDGLLNLSGGKGARILFIASDGHFVASHHNEYAYKAMAECKAAGVQVFWLDYDGYLGMGRYPDYGYGEKIDLSRMSVMEQAKTIGNLVVTTFDKVKAV